MATASHLTFTAPTAFDPPDTSGARTPDLSPEELRRIRTGLGWRPQRPGGTAEPTAELKPFRARGLYPEPGLYYRMVARDPIIASGLEKLENSFRALPWRILGPEPPRRGVFSFRDAEIEEARLEHVRNTLASFSLSAVAALAMRRSYESGFALAERVWEIEETSGWWRLEDLVWVESWQIRQWITDDATGYATAIWFTLQDEVVPFAKYAYWGRDFTGRNYEGRSALRPLYWYDESKRRTLVREEMAQDRFGIGTRKWKVQDDAGAIDYTAIDTIEDDYSRNQQERVILPRGVDMEFEHGGSIMPDFASKVRAVDHQISRMLDDTLQELGVSQFGARAVGSEMRKSAERTAHGLAILLAHTLTRELIVPIYEQNGWPVQRAPYIWVSGFADHDKWRVIAELVREEIIPRDDPDLLEAAKMDFGIGR